MGHRKQAFTCEICGGVFLRRYREDHPPKFCSRKCSAQYVKKHMSGKDSPSYAKVDKECVICKKQYSVSPSHADRRKTCGDVKCLFEYRSNLYSRENNPNYRDVSREYPIEFNDKLTSKIRDRDEHVCQNCGMSEAENISKFGRVLDVHHIDYDKNNSAPTNLISLCFRCHIRTVTANRQFWISFYTQKMTLRQVPKERFWGGLDPGQQGSISFIGEESHQLFLYPMPTSSKEEHSRFSILALSDVFRTFQKDTIKFVIEKAQAMPKQGVVSMFNYGAGYGMCLGGLSIFEYDYEEVRPQTWTKIMLEGAQGEGKERAYGVARRMFPQWQPKFKKEYQYCDSILLAEYARRNHTGRLK